MFLPFMLAAVAFVAPSPAAVPWRTQLFTPLEPTLALEIAALHGHGVFAPVRPVPFRAPVTPTAGEPFSL